MGVTSAGDGLCLPAMSRPTPLLFALSCAALLGLAPPASAAPRARAKKSSRGRPTATPSNGTKADTKAKTSAVAKATKAGTGAGLAKRRRAISGWWDEPLDVPFPRYPGTALLRMPIPPGSWVINAKAVLVGHVDAHGIAGCRIIAGSDSDKAQVHFVAPDDNSSPLWNFNGNAVSLQVVHTFTSHSSVILQCWGETKKSDFTSGPDRVKHTGRTMPVLVQDIKITAVEVDDLTNTPLKLVK